MIGVSEFTFLGLSAGSQRAQGLQKRQAPKFKTRGPKRFFCSLFQRGIKTTRCPEESKPPKTEPQNKKTRGSKSRAAKNVFVPSLDKETPKSEAKKIIGVRKFQNSQFIFFNTPETFQRMK
jgi:hypothetical protein